MALFPDFPARIVRSDASISDAVAFHAALRDIESSDEGILYPSIHSYREVQLGGGALFPAVKFVNGWRLEFPAGNWEVSGGNVDAPIVPIPGCYVRVTQSAAYAVTSVGGAVTPDELAAAVLAAAQVAPIHSDVRKVHGIPVKGSGSPGDEWGPG